MSSSTKAVLLKLSSGEVLICKVGLPDAAGAFQPVADWTEVVGRVDVDVLELEDVLMLQYTLQPQQQGGQAAPNISISFVVSQSANLLILVNNDEHVHASTLSEFIVANELLSQDFVVLVWERFNERVNNMLNEWVTAQRLVRNF